MGNERDRYWQHRRKQLEKLACRENEMDEEEDLELFNDFKPFRDRANREPEYTPPRYDKVYVEGTKWLNSL